MQKRGDSPPIPRGPPTPDRSGVNLGLVWLVPRRVDNTDVWGYLRIRVDSYGFVRVEEIDRPNP